MSAQREVLFRAKCLGWDEGLNATVWLEGHYVPFCYDMDGDPFYEAIIDGHGEVWNIDRATLCQFTGLGDEDGEKIWEHSIIEACDLLRGGVIGEVVFKEGSFVIEFDKTEDIVIKYLSEIQVIGNIFDNPEMMEVEK